MKFNWPFRISYVIIIFFILLIFILLDINIYIPIIISILIPLISEILVIPYIEKLEEEKEENGNRFHVIEEERSEGQRNLDNLINITSRLYITRRNSSLVFARTIHESLRFQELFGISARTQTGRSIDDIPIGFFDGRYYIIPNSAYLRTATWRDQNNTLLTWNSSEEEINEVLTRFFNDGANYLRERFDFDVENTFQTI